MFFFWERISKVTNSCKRNRCKIQLWDIRYTYICRSIYEFFYLLFCFRLSSSQTLRLDCLDSRKLHNNQLIHFVPIMSNFISNSEKLHICLPMYICINTIKITNLHSYEGNVLGETGREGKTKCLPHLQEQGNYFYISYFIVKLMF